jgi:hypothetical protein
MPKILAANNLTISTEDRNWRLFNGRGDESAPIVEALPDGLRYGPAFASARRLSADGRLPAQSIATVVVGWAVEDSSWHLGVLVTPDVARTRGGRWCALARWDNYQGDQAERAGAALAATLDKPFRFVPPPEMAQPALPVEQASAPVTTWPSAPAEMPALYPAPPIEAPALMPLPIELGEWILQEDLLGLRWVRVQSWRTRTLLYALFSLGLGIVFGALSLGARFSPFAPVQPDYLPLVGLVISAVVILIGLWQLVTLLRATSVLIDNQQKLVRVMRGKRRVIVQSPYEGLEYILVSHVLSRRDRSSAEMNRVAYDRILAETWLHLYSPRRGFIPICYAEHTEGRIRSGLAFDQRRSLSLGEIDTPAHHAATIMAEMIGIPAYVEER